MKLKPFLLLFSLTLYLSTTADSATEVWQKAISAFQQKQYEQSKAELLHWISLPSTDSNLLPLAHQLLVLTAQETHDPSLVNHYLPLTPPYFQDFLETRLLLQNHTPQLLPASTLSNLFASQDSLDSQFLLAEYYYQSNAFQTLNQWLHSHFKFNSQWPSAQQIYHLLLQISVATQLNQTQQLPQIQEQISQLQHPLSKEISLLLNQLFPNNKNQSNTYLSENHPHWLKLIYLHYLSQQPAQLKSPQLFCQLLLQHFTPLFNKNEFQYWNHLTHSTLNKIKNFQDLQLRQSFLQWSKNLENLPPSPILNQAKTTHALWLIRTDQLSQAQTLLEQIILNTPDSSQNPEAYSLISDLYTRLNQPSKTQNLLNQWLNQSSPDQHPFIFEKIALLQLLLGQPELACSSYLKAAQITTSFDQKLHCLFQSGIQALLLSDPSISLKILEELQNLKNHSFDPSALTKIDYLLRLLNWNKLLLSSSTDSQPWLDFVNQQTDPLWKARGLLSLLEKKALSTNPTDWSAPIIDQTFNALKSLNLPHAKIQQRTLMMRIWFAENLAQYTNTIALTQQYLNLWPDSPDSTEISMRLANSLFQAEQFTQARSIYLKVIKDSPTSPWHDQALYQASLCSSATLTQEGNDHALQWLLTLIEKKSPLATQATLRQAQILRNHNQITQAHTILEKLLNTTLPNHLQQQIILQQLELLIHQPKPTPDHLKNAQNILNKELPQATNYLWRCELGLAQLHLLKKLNLATQAITQTQAIITQRPPQLTHPLEIKVFVELTFNCIQLLEQHQQWKSAVALTDIIAQTNSPRAAEAREHSNLIKLKHLIWDN